MLEIVPNLLNMNQKKKITLANKRVIPRKIPLGYKKPVKPVTSKQEKSVPLLGVFFIFLTFAICCGGLLFFLKNRYSSDFSYQSVQSDPKVESKPKLLEENISLDSQPEEPNPSKSSVPLVKSVSSNQDNSDFASYVPIPSISEDQKTITYRAPEGIQSSKDFSAKVNGEEAYVFYAAPNDFREDFVPGAANGENDVFTIRDSWVSLETIENPELTVKPLKNKKKIKEVFLINQSGDPISHSINDAKDAISFKVTAGEKYYLSVNQQYDSRFLVFAEKPEEIKPNPLASDTFIIHEGMSRYSYENSDKKVLYFTAGIHEIGAQFPLKSGQTLYLEAGAYLKGTLSCKREGANGAKVIGRGILSGEVFYMGSSPNTKYLPRPTNFYNNAIYLGGANREQADKQTVRGITIIYSPDASIYGMSSNTTIENVKIMNHFSKFGTICVGKNATVQNNYCSSDTRLIRVLGSNGLIRNNFLHGRKEKAQPLVFGDRIQHDVDDIQVIDNLIVGNCKNLIRITNASHGNLSNFNFSGIKYIMPPGTTDSPKLVYMGMGYSPYRRGKYQGSIKNVTIDNVAIVADNPSNKTFFLGLEAFGFSEEASVRNVSISNITCNGRAVKFGDSIQDYVYNFSVEGNRIAKGKDKKIKMPKRKEIPFVGGLKSYPRKDQYGDEYGSRFAHDVVYKNKSESISRLLKMEATGASIEGIETLPDMDKDFLDVYSGIDDPRTYANASSDYEVSVAQKSSGSLPKESYVYENVGIFMTGGNDRLMNPPPAMTEHFSNYTHKGPVEISIKMKEAAPAAEDVVIIPRRYGIKPILSEGNRKISFSVDQPRYLIVIVNNDWCRPLFLFGNPPEKSVPDPSDPAVLTILPNEDYRKAVNRSRLKDYRVIRFAPGYHDIGFYFPIYSNQTIYLAGGSYVAGTISSMTKKWEKLSNFGVKRGFFNKKIYDSHSFQAYNNPEDFILFKDSDEMKENIGASSNITIRGRGILSAEQMDWFKYCESIKIIKISKESNNGILEGLVLMGRHHHGPKMMSSNTTAACENIKIIHGFHGNTDACGWGYKRRNIFTTQADDGTYFQTGLDVDGWLAWQQNNANLFCIQRKAVPNGGTLGHVVIRNVTAIDGRYGGGQVKNLREAHYSPAGGGVWFGFNHDRFPYAYITDIVMKDIYFETNINSTFMFTAIAQTKETKMLSADHLTFDDFSVYGKQNRTSIFGTRPKAPDDFMKNINIRNLTINGEKMKRLEDFSIIGNEGRNLNVKIR